MELSTFLLLTSNKSLAIWPLSLTAAKAAVFLTPPGPGLSRNIKIGTERGNQDRTSSHLSSGDPVLPLEPALMQSLRHNWRNQSNIADLRQDVYERVFAAALKELPAHPRQFVFTTARNLLINRIRDEQVVPFEEAVTEIDALNTTIAATGPDRTVQAAKT